MLKFDPQRRDRLVSGAGVSLIHALLGYLLLTGLGFEIGPMVKDELKMFDVTEEPPPPPAEPAAPEKVEKSDKAKPKDPEGAASPANLKNTPTEIVAPKPRIVIPVPPPVVVAPVAGTGTAFAAGAAAVPGPGTGRGGIGNGLGSGSQGTGTGGGGGGLGRGASARWISGSVDPEDHPGWAVEAGIGGTVHMRLTVTPAGRVSDCRVTRSSGNSRLDSVTCRLVIRRLRYRPALDVEGRPIASTVPASHEWGIRRGRTEVIEEEEVYEE